MPRVPLFSPSEKKCIYLIVNIFNNNKYVGSTTSYRQRRSNHIIMLKTGTHSNPRIQEDFNIYGIEAFDFKILEPIKFGDSIKEREQFWLDKINPEYNYCKIAYSSVGLNKGRKKDKSFGQIIAMKTMKPISQYDMDGNLISDWPSAKIAASELKLRRSAISAACRGRLKSTGGFQWRYTKDIPPGKIYNKKCFRNRPVLQIDKYNQLVKEWSSVSDICSYFKISPSLIRSSCKDGHKSQGFYWKFKDEYQNK